MAELAAGRVYCEICGRVITPSNSHEVETGEDDKYEYTHDPIPHDLNEAIDKIHLLN